MLNLQIAKRTNKQIIISQEIFSDYQKEAVTPHESLQT